MKKLHLLIAVFLGFVSAQAQENPFAEYGYTPKIATLSQGQFNESFDNDTIVQIGSVLFNTKSKQIVAFVEYDTLYSEATLEPDIVSRWMSPDPLADHPNQIGMSPYSAMWNNPIIWNDPDGRCPWCLGALVGAAVDVGIQALEISLDDNKTYSKDFSWSSVGVSTAAGATGVGLLTKVKKANTLIKIATSAGVDGAASAGTQLAKEGEVNATDVAIDVVAGQTVGKIASDLVDSKIVNTKTFKELTEGVNQQKNIARGKSNTTPKSKADVDGAKTKLTGYQVSRSVGASVASSQAGSFSIKQITKHLETEEK